MFSPVWLSPLKLLPSLSMSFSEHNLRFFDLKILYCNNTAAVQQFFLNKNKTVFHNYLNVFSG